jgi:methanogenic corrinoid protein MtbC1
VNAEILMERLFQALVCGDRQTARNVIDECALQNVAAESLAHEIFWPVMETVNALFRNDQLTTLAHHYATRLLRTLVDQAQARYAQKPRRGRKILMFCGPKESDELAAQLVADLAEADGYDVYFGGGGIANDEILAEVGEQNPDVLLMFASAPTDAPHIRQLIDSIRNVGAHPGLQIVVGGGVFNRAEGLAEEIGADVWARSPQELLEKLLAERHRRASAGQRTVGRTRRNAAAA